MTIDAGETSSATPYAAPALDKGLDILELLSTTEMPLSQRDIAQGIGRNVGEIYRMLTCLVRRDYVRLVGESYILTTRLFELAHSNPPTRRLLTEARPIMEGLSSELDQSCHLTVWGNGKQLVVAKVDTPSGMGFSVRVGSELEVAVSASGRVLLAFQEDSLRDFRIREAATRQPNTETPELPIQLAAIRARGYELARSVQVLGLQAVSFPIYDGQGYAIAALTVPYAERIDRRESKSLTQAQRALGDAARELSLRIGGRPDPVHEPATVSPAVSKRPARSSAAKS
jgi:DNA-binding IclR family transcriptional regulator